MELARESFMDVPLLKKAAQALGRHQLAITMALAFCYILFRILGADAAATIFFVLISLEIVLSGTVRITCLMFFFTPIFLYVTLGTFPIYNVILLVLFLKRCVIEKTGIPLFPLFTILLLAAIEVAGMMFSGVGFSANQLKFFMIILVTAMQLYNPPDGYDNRQGVKYMIFGTFLYAAFYVAENFNTVLNDSTRTGGLGDLDPNTYALYNLFALSLILLSFLNHTLSRREAVIYCVIAVVLLLAGLMTLSKTFVLCSCLMFTLYFLASRRKLGILAIAAVLAAVIVLLIQGNSFMNGVYRTIVARFTASSMLSGLTTGRSDIYFEFLSALSQHPLVVFTGSGMYSYLQTLGIENRPHNCVIEMISAWGISGTGMVLLMYMKGRASYLSHMNRHGKAPLVSYVPLITLVVFMQSLTLMFEEATYAYLCMAVMATHSPGFRRLADPAAGYGVLQP